MSILAKIKKVIGIYMKKWQPIKFRLQIVLVFSNKPDFLASRRFINRIYSDTLPEFHL